MNTYTPSVSIIVPVYNAGTTLERCVDSILAQSYTDFEVILIDDGSKDSSCKICNEYAASDHRIKVIHKDNGGVSSARNAGLDTAIGKFIAFVDADDEVGKNWLANMLSAIVDCEICVCGITINKTQKKAPGKFTDKENLFSDLLKKNLFGFLFIKLYRKEIIDRYSLRFNTDLRWREDDVFNANYFEHVNKFAISDSCEYIYYAPSAEKNYGGASATQCAVPLFKSYLQTFNGTIPAEICRLQGWTVKGEVERLMLEGNLPSHDLIEIYTLVFRKFSGTKRNLKERIKDFFIIHSHKLGPISIFFIRKTNALLTRHNQLQFKSEP